MIMRHLPMVLKKSHNLLYFSLQIGRNEPFSFWMDQQVWAPC